MRVIQSNLWLCDDCSLAATNGETPQDDSQAELTLKGLESFGPNLVPDFDFDTGAGYCGHSSHACDCCKSRLHGSRHRFAILGENNV